MAERVITVEVVYLDTEHQHVRRINVAENSSVLEAIEASGIAKVIPAGAIDTDRLGIFSRRVSGNDLVQQGDRVEIYRPLVLDPMEARRKRGR